jgi:gas vesicle protein
MSEKNTNVKDFVIGAAIGGVVGVLTALLFAPKSGKELRMDISDQVRNASEKTQDLAAATDLRSRQIVRAVGSQTSEWVDKARDAAVFVTGEIKSWKDLNNK